jgi:hypothetical protein
MMKIKNLFRVTERRLPAEAARTSNVRAKELRPMNWAFVRSFSPIYRALFRRPAILHLRRTQCRCRRAASAGRRLAITGLIA